MTVQPTGTIIPTPTIPPGSDQLTDIATVISTNDPHLAHGGTYETVCGTGVMIGGNFPCAPINMNRGLGQLTWVNGVPGTVFTGLQCIGPMDLPSMQATAMKNNDLRVNRTIQDNLIGGFIPVEDFEVRPATEAGGLADADTIARCEYTGQAVIHINPTLAEQWMGKEIIRVGRHLETVMGAMVSLNCWLPVDQIAVTGWLTVLKGASRVMDPYHDVSGSGEPTNWWYVNVQTPVTVFNDCELAVLITGVEGGGPPPVAGPVTVTAVSPDTIPLDDVGGYMVTVTGTGFSKTSVVLINNEAARTTYSSPTSLTALFVPEEFFPLGPGSYPVGVIGSNSVTVEVIEGMRGPASTIVSPSAGQVPGTAMHLRLYEYVGAVNDPQYPDGTTDLVDADIVSIDWGDGTALQTPPFTRGSRAPLIGQFIAHTYANAGDFDITANLAENFEPATTTFYAYPVAIYYYLQKNPATGGVLVGAPFGVRPVDGSSNPLPPNDHFTTIDWGDGTAIQSPPFTVDGGGYATHTYAAAGTFAPQVTFVSDQEAETSITITVAATQEDLDALNAAEEDATE
jgi:hypothetical protein